MAAQVRIEWVRFGAGPGYGGVAHNVIRSFHGAEELEVSQTATSAVNRPEAPAFGPATDGYALVRNVGDADASIVVAWGDDPTAARLGGKLIAPGEEVPIHCQTGTLFSFLEVA